MKIAILQSNYIPWKGYFDIINLVDLFIFWDDVQYTPRGWRNRNKIKTKNGLIWLSVPCGRDRDRLIYKVDINEHSWQKKHWKAINIHYKKSKYLEYYRTFFEEIYLKRIWKNLSEMNQYIIKKIAIDIFNMTTVFDDSRNYILKETGRQERVLELLHKVEATEYLVGPTAKEYFDPNEFTRNNIKLTWMDYNGYPEYRQLYPPFVHEVSVLDLIFNEGPDARNFLKSVYYNN
jgi:WbqC-like protein family